MVCDCVVLVVCEDQACLGRRIDGKRMTGNEFAAVGKARCDISGATQMEMRRAYHSQERSAVDRKSVV